MTPDDCFKRTFRRMKNGRPYKDMAVDLNVGQNTPGNWYRNPEGMNLYYLRLFVRTYHIRDAEILTWIRGEEENV